MGWYYASSPNQAWRGAFFHASTDAAAMDIGKENIRCAVRCGYLVHGETIKIKRLSSDYSTSFDNVVEKIWAKDDAVRLSNAANARDSAAAAAAAAAASRPEPASEPSLDRQTPPQSVPEPAAEPPASAPVPEPVAHAPKRTAAKSIGRPTSSAPERRDPSLSRASAITVPMNASLAPTPSQHFGGLPSTTVVDVDDDSSEEWRHTAPDRSIFEERCPGKRRRSA